MPQFELKVKSWYDEYEHLTYLVLEKDGKQFWSSCWWEPQDLWDEGYDLLNNLRNMIKDLAEEYNIEIDTSGEYWEWHVKS